MKNTERSYHEIFIGFLRKEGVPAEKITKVINFLAQMTLILIKIFF